MKMIVSAAVVVGLAVTPTLAASKDKPQQLSFREMDKNGSETVDFEEWKAGNRNPRMFAKIDTDGNGEISLEEMRAQEKRWREEREAREADQKN